MMKSVSGSPTNAQRPNSVAPAAGLKLAERLGWAFFALGTAVCLGVGFGLAAMALPAWDDYSRAIWNQDYSFTEYIFGFNYFRHGGRWAGYGFSAWVLTAVDLHAAYPWLLAGIFAVQIANFHFLFTGIFQSGRAGGGWREPARHMAAALAAWAVFWTSTPDPAASLYWFTGAVEYHLGFSLFVLCMVFVWKRARAHESIPAWVVAAAALAVFVLAAVHELLGLTICAVLLGLCAAGFADRRAAWRGLAVMSAAAAAGFASLVLAPGNYVRAEHIENQTAGTAEIFKIALKYLDTEIFPMLLNPQLVLGAALLGVCVAGSAQTRLRAPRLSLRAAAILAAVNLLIAAAWVGIPVIVNGAAPPARVTNGLYHLHATSMVLWVAIAAGYTAGFTARDHGETGALQERLRLWRVGLLFALGGFLIFGGNTLLGVNDLVNRAPLWRAERIARETMISIAPGNTADPAPASAPVMLDALSIYPMLLPHGEITKDPDHWINRAYGKYFGCEWLAVGPDEPMDGFRPLD